MNDDGETKATDLACGYPVPNKNHGMDIFFRKKAYLRINPAVLPLKYMLPWTSMEELNEAETAPAQRRRTFKYAFSSAGYDRGALLVF